MHCKPDSAFWRFSCIFPPSPFYSICAIPQCPSDPYKTLMGCSHCLSRSMPTKVSTSTRGPSGGLIWAENDPTPSFSLKSQSFPRRCQRQKPFSSFGRFPHSQIHFCVEIPRHLRSVDVTMGLLSVVDILPSSDVVKEEGSSKGRLAVISSCRRFFPLISQDLS